MAQQEMMKDKEGSQEMVSAKPMKTVKAKEEMIKVVALVNMYKNLTEFEMGKEYEIPKAMYDAEMTRKKPIFK